jgi:hypothetical protein
MAKYFVTKSGLANAAVDVVAAVNINSVGTGTSDLNVPAGVTRLARIRAAIARVTLVASVGVTLILILRGSGVKDGPHEIPIGVHVEDTTTTAGAKIAGPYDIDCGLELVPGNPLILEVVAKGTDAGNEEVSIGLEME